MRHGASPRASGVGLRRNEPGPRALIAYPRLFSLRGLGGEVRRCSDGNKKTAVAVFLSMASVNLPTAIERRSPLFAGSTQPGRPARTHTLISRSTEMKPLMLASTTLAHKPFARNGARVETLWREHLARHFPTRRARRFDHCRGNPTLRVSARVRQTREMEGSLGAGQVIGD